MTTKILFNIRDLDLAWCLHRFLYVKVVVAAFNQEEALLGASSVMVKT